MDPLTEQLMQRQMSQQGSAPGLPSFSNVASPPGSPLQKGALPAQNVPAPHQIGSPVPATPPNPDPKLPSAEQRFSNAQQIQDAYRGGWETNPVLLQASLSK